MATSITDAMTAPLDLARLAYVEKMGYDCAKNGTNDSNCHFALFSRAEYTQAWERGKAKAERDAAAKQEGK